MSLKRPFNGENSAPKRAKGNDGNTVDTVMASALHEPTTDEVLVAVSANLALETKVRMLIPSECVGLVIGKAGSTIKAINEKSGGRVHISKEEEMPPGSRSRLVRIEGTARSVSLAQQIITTLIRESVAQDAEAKCELQLVIPVSCGGIVIGQGGETVRALIATSQAHISLSSTVPGATDRVVTVTGDFVAVFRAQALICVKIEEARLETPGRYDLIDAPKGHQGNFAPAPFSAGRADPFSSPFGGPPVVDGPQTTATIQVSNADVGSIIGRQGSVIKSLQSVTGARIHISDTDPSSDYRTVQVTGPSSAVAHAQHLIAAAIAQGAAAAPSRAPAAPIPVHDGPTVTVNLELSNEQCSAVIGRGGNVIRQLQAATACRLHISEHVAGSPTRTLTLTGSQESVDSCNRLVRDVLENPTMAAPGGGAPPPARAGDSSVEMVIPQNQIGAVIGHGGENIKSIQAATGCRMKISEYEKDSLNRILNITGPAHAVGHAQQLVEASLHANAGPVAPQHFAPPASYGNYAPAASAPSALYGQAFQYPTQPAQSSYGQAQSYGAPPTYGAPSYSTQGHGYAGGYYAHDR